MSKQRRARVRQFIFAFYMSGIMSMMMSGVITVINTGLAAGFFARWGSAFLVAWGVAFPLVIFVAPLAGRLTEKTLARLLGDG
ncbi:hypothetical protein BTO32_14490 [Marinobacter lutaoensis]|uniref:DUF2798 domain-containing protein n=1 Tax=Marinobacter lutaoensis TaxID=135739 RepID=A0A1V2DQG4_9GAMM|nr:DUF2798 domain-containing protein [Marinobacter lutaoensis]ONF42883.1 hypothetical protein BTO32_14490 [Marinobacter lutaoensis]